MNKFFGIFLAMTIAAVALFSPVSASARGGSNGGGGGGGGSTVESGTPIIFDQFTSINGSLPSWTGTCTLTNAIPGYYTWYTVQISVKGKPINVPDNTRYLVTVYTSDAATGAPMDPYAAGYVNVLSKTGTAKSTGTIFVSGSQAVVRKIDGVVITAADGSIVAIGHP